MSYTEQALVFNCGDCRLLGIIALPEVATETGVLILTGGPQYRAGSHRQFTLLARQLAEQGVAAMRFDYRGMGDSEGEMRNFELIDADIRAAIDCYTRHAPSVRRIILWGLCDAASAALFYGHTDKRVSGMILLNPWVHTEAGAARTRLKHYYLSRLMQRAFWKKLLSGRVELRKSVGDLNKSAQSVLSANAMTDTRNERYIPRMLEGLRNFRGEILILLSGNDLVAQEFIALTHQSKHWGKLCKSERITHMKIEQANHTFSSHIWRNEVACATLQWISRQGARG